MENIKIYCSEDSDLIELEVLQKGWRGDILVIKEDCSYIFKFITLNRLNNEYKNESLAKRIYLIKSGTFIVEDISKNSIINTIVKWLQTHSLDDFEMIDLQEEFKNTFPELQDIQNWVRIY